MRKTSVERINGEFFVDFAIKDMFYSTKVHPCDFNIKIALPSLEQAIRKNFPYVELCKIVHEGSGHPSNDVVELTFRVVADSFAQAHETGVSLNEFIRETCVMMAIDAKVESEQRQAALLRLG
jgi:hypothetical protein